MTFASPFIALPCPRASNVCNARGSAGFLGIALNRESLGEGGGRAAAARAGRRMFGRRGGERLVHEPADRAGAMAAFGAASQAAVDLRRGARAVRPRVEAAAHIRIGEKVAGTDDHRAGNLEELKTDCLAIT